MVHRQFRSRLRRKGSPLALAAAIAGWAVLMWLIWIKSVPEDHREAINSWALDVFISSIVYEEFGSRKNEELASFFDKIESINHEEELHLACEFAKKEGWLTNDGLYQWALASHALGDREKAREILRDAPPPQSTRARNIHHFFEGTEIDEEIEAWIAEQRMLQTESWDVLYIMAQTENGEAANDRLDYAGDYVFRKGIESDLILISLFIFSAFSWIPLLRQRFGFRFAHSPVSSLWRWQAVAFWFFVLFVGSSAASYLLSAGLESLNLRALSSVLGFVIYLGLPVLGLSLFFCPGFEAMRHLFRIRWEDWFDHFIPVTLLALAGFFLLNLADLGLGWLQLQAGHLDVRDFLQPDAISGGLTGFGYLLTLVIFAPFLEEILYRGFLFRAFTNRIGPMGGAIVSSGIFATYHWYSLFGWISIFISGLVFTWQAHRSGSLWPGMITHSLVNLMYFISVTGWYNFQ